MRLLVQRTLEVSLSAPLPTNYKVEGGLLPGNISQSWFFYCSIFYRSSNHKTYLLCTTAKLDVCLFVM